MSPAPGNGALSRRELKQMPGRTPSTAEIEETPGSPGEIGTSPKRRLDLDSERRRVEMLRLEEPKQTQPSEGPRAKELLPTGADTGDAHRGHAARGRLD